MNARIVAVSRTPKTMMRIVGLRAVANQKRLVRRKTGNLARTIHLASVSERSAVTEASADYAAAVERGSKPHIIRPRKAKALRFPAAGSPTTLGGRVKAGGKFAFAKIVHHPGTKAQPYMVPGAEEAAKASGLKGIIVQAWNKAA